MSAILGVVLAIGAVVVGALAGSLLTKTMSAQTVVVTPPPAGAGSQLVPAIVDRLPQETSARVLQDVSIFDLRLWKPVLPADSGKRTSPVVYTDYLRVAKLPGVDTLVAHYSTTGTAIDFVCPMQRCNVRQAKVADHPGEHQYALSVDLSGLEPEQQTLVVVQAIYWNGFRNAGSEYVETYSDSDTDPSADLRLIALLPPDKPYGGYSVFTKSEGSAVEEPYRGAVAMTTDPDRRFLNWRVRDHSGSRHYVLRWSW